MQLSVKRSVLLLLALVAAPAAAAESPPWSGQSVMEDPEWRKRFLGSYGFLSGAEPQVNPTEIEVLREVIDLMEAQPKAAQSRLLAAVGPGSSASLDFVLANLEFQNGENEAAAEHYRSAIEKFPDFRRAHKNLGLLLVQEARHGEAREHLGRAVELGDRDGRNFGLLGFCYLQAEDYLPAEEAYRNAILQEPETRDWKLGLARSLLAQEKYADAVSLFGSLIEADADDTTSWLLQANSYIGLDQPLAAAVNIEAVRMLGKAQSSSLILLGDIYMKSGMPELAKDAYLEVIEKDEGAAQYATAQRAAELLIRTRSWREAQEILASIDRRYGKQLPDSDALDVMTLKAKVARARGQEQEAARLLETVVKRDGTRGDALLELASYHQKQGNTEKAVFLVERAENLDAFAYQALLQHAQLMVSAKDYTKGAGLLRRAIQIKSEPRVEGFLARVEEAARR
jgi:tetratricopeptide (TPR) repeat protein